MCTLNYRENTVTDVIDKIPEASYVLRSYDVGVGKSNRLLLSEAAQAVSSTTDEMLAVMEYRLRRNISLHA